jgi:putative SOS response-associated peptidase YedK
VNAKGKLLKQPMFIHRADGDPLAVAGLWTRWKDPDDPDGRFLHSATVITTAANHTMEPVHDRMPVILASTQWATWLDPANDDLDALGTLLVGCDDDVLVMHEVSTEVNNVRNNRADLVAHVE